MKRVPGRISYPSFCTRLLQHAERAGFKLPANDAKLTLCEKNQVELARLIYSFSAQNLISEKFLFVEAGLPNAVGVVVEFYFVDGIDQGFEIAVGIYPKDDPYNYAFLGTLAGPVSNDASGVRAVLKLQSGHTFPASSIDSAVLYLVHKQGPNNGGGGRDNCNGNVTSCTFIFDDGSQIVYAGPTLLGYAFAIGNHNVSTDININLSY